MRCEGEEVCKDRFGVGSSPFHERDLKDKILSHYYAFNDAYTHTHIHTHTHTNTHTQTLVHTMNDPAGGQTVGQLFDREDWSADSMTDALCFCVDSFSTGGLPHRPSPPPPSTRPPSKKFSDLWD